MPYLLISILVDKNLILSPFFVKNDQSRRNETDHEWIIYKRSGTVFKWLEPIEIVSRRTLIIQTHHIKTYKQEIRLKCS